MGHNILCFLTLLAHVPLLKGQTVQSYFNTCFGSGIRPGVARMVRSFLPNMAHAYHTPPQGLEVVRRLETYGCIHGFYLPPDPTLHHLAFTVSEAYFEKATDSNWKEPISISLKIFSLVDGGPEEIHNVTIKSVNTHPSRTFVRVHPDQLFYGPVYIGLEHNIPRGMNNLVHVHLSLVVTPVYECHRTTLIASHPELLTDLNKIENENPSANLFKCGQLPNSTDHPKHLTDVCINMELVCDGYRNCPLTGGVSDESAKQCRAQFISQYNTVVWFLVSITCPIIAITVVVMLWATHRQFRHCCHRYFQKRNSDLGTEYDDTMTATARSYSEAQRQSFRRCLEQKVSWTNRLPPHLAPPTYQEALGENRFTMFRTDSNQAHSITQNVHDSLSQPPESERVGERLAISHPLESLSFTRPPTYSQCLPVVTQDAPHV